MSLPDAKAQNIPDLRHSDRERIATALGPAESPTVSHLAAGSRVELRGDMDAAFARLYSDLRKLAQQFLKGERPDHTLAATALVHEAYLRLMQAQPESIEERTRFFGLAARAMRQILVDHARRRQAAKRGGAPRQTTLHEEHSVTDLNLEEMLALESALDRLGEISPRLKAVVEYRFYCGLESQHISALLGVSERTVERDWLKARAWLYSELYAAPAR